jgi:hypothetical protein
LIFDFLIFSFFRFFSRFATHLAFLNLFIRPLDHGEKPFSYGFLLTHGSTDGHTERVIIR